MKLPLIFLLAALIACQEKQETYKEIKTEICYSPIKSEKDLAWMIKDIYPEYDSWEDSVLTKVFLKKYPHFEKLQECYDVKLKMELAKIEHKEGVYKIFWKADLSARENYAFVPIPREVVVKTKNGVKLFSLCNNCDWKGKDGKYEIESNEYIESIDVWNKIDSLKFVGKPKMMKGQGID